MKRIDENTMVTPTVTARDAVAVIGAGAILPSSPNVNSFWENVREGRYLIREVPEDRWSVDAYYDPDPSVPDKTYTKLGAFVEGFDFDFKRFRIPPRTVQSMDGVQLWAMAAAGQALDHAGYIDKDYDRERTGVILGNSMAGELQYSTSARVLLPEVIAELEKEPHFLELPAGTKASIIKGLRAGVAERMPEVTEDSMPGELSNVISGRVANAFNLGGANYTVDAACASSLAALNTSINGLRRGEYDMVVTGGVDRSMSPPMFVKFCKIGALSASGSYPFDARASGFVMGEGCAVFVLKRLVDAVNDGDNILSMVLGIGSSSDGRGKGIAAPNKAGQLRALRRAYEDAGVRPDEIDLIEAHGTATKVGDPMEVEALAEIFDADTIGKGRLALGSVKSQIGHLKSAAGAAAILKTALALHHKIMPPSVNYETPNPAIPFEKMAFRVQTSADEWKNGTRPRRAGISAFGFGGTNFHLVMQEAPAEGFFETTTVSTSGTARTQNAGEEKKTMTTTASVIDDILERVAFMWAETPDELMAKLGAGERPARLGSLEDVKAFCTRPCRLAMAFKSEEEIGAKSEKLVAGMKDGFDPSRMKLFEKQGVHVGTGPAMKVGFLFPGQGSQSVGMLKDLYDRYPSFKAVFDKADAVMSPILGHSITDIVYGDASDDEKKKKLDHRLKQTEVTQPAMLTADAALMKLLGEAGLDPDMVVGHSLGEYAALMAAGVLDLDAALEIVAARGREMASVSLDDPGRMVAAMTDAETVYKIIEKVDGYLVPANKNSSTQTVVAGESEAIERLIKAFEDEGIRAVPLKVSHAFHSRIVAPASEPLSRVLKRHEWHPNNVRVFTNVTGEAYPDKAGKDVYVDVLAKQIASPVEFVGCVKSMYGAGARFYVEVGPRRVLASFADDILKDVDEPVKVTSSNHHRQKDLDALAAMYAAAASAGSIGTGAAGTSPAATEGGGGGGKVSSRSTGTASASQAGGPSIVISGTALGLPGRDRMLFSDENVEDLLMGKNFLEAVPEEVRQIFPTLNMTKIDKGNGEEMTEKTVSSSADAIKLAGMAGKLDLAGDYGVDRSFVETMDTTARMAVAAGLEALRDAGIPLVLETRTTRKGVVLPVGWVLPEALRSETGVIFGSCFPGFDRFAQELEAYHEHRLAGKDYAFDRKVLFGILAMGHTQFAQAIKATGPNLQVNAACASGALAIATASDWMKAGRCKRVIVVTADEASSPHMLPWVGGGFLSNGAAATDARVEDAALPFDERRHGLLIGAGGAALVLEVEDEVRARGAAPLARVVHTQISNSAFHASRINSEHITGEMVRFLSDVKDITGKSPADLADQLIFLSHETYTPARGGSADTEVDALRAGFGIRDIHKVLVTNTKGFTGHPMGTGFEDAIAPWILHTGRVPPIANLAQTDRRFVDLNLSRGGRHDARWILRFSAGFGSQVAMILFEKASEDQVRIVDRSLNEAWMEGLLGGKPAALEVEGRVLHLVEASQVKAVKVESVHEEPTVAASTGGLRSRIMALISEKTGYPEDMLDPEMDMEADLGIDTVKQAEVFAAVRRAYDIPRQDNLKLSDYPTINHVVEFVRSSGKDEAPVVAAAPAAEPEPSQPPSETPAPAAPGRNLLPEIMKVVAEKTGYPEDMLDPDMDMEADLGIDTVKQAELFATVRRTYEIPRQDNLKLSDYPTINHVVEFVRGFVKDEAPVEAAAPAAPAPVEPVAEAPAPAPASGRDLLAEVMAVVAEKTGYPEDMLDPDMDMEADLGIDTVKQAELFASVRRTYEIPRQDNLKLSDYPTINHVVEFVRGFVKDEAPVEAAAPAAPAPVEPVAEAPAPAPASGRDLLAEVMAVVAEKTGYPEDMLDPDMDMEADLGIDTVKQAELFASVRRIYEIPRQDNLKLSDYPTINHVVEFVRGFVKDEAPVEEAVASPAPTPSATPDLAVESFEARMLVPRPRWMPPASAFGETGQSLDGGDDPVVLAGSGRVHDALKALLEERGVPVLSDARGKGRVRGVILVDDPEHGSLDPAGIDSYCSDVVDSAVERFNLVKELVAEKRLEAGSGFVLGVTGMGGTFGYGSDAPGAPSGGALAGFVKALTFEMPGSLVKVVDLDPADDAGDCALRVVREVEGDPLTTEIGYSTGQRWGVTLDEQPPPAGDATMLPDRPVILMTGGAGGIMVEIAEKLASRYAARLVLTDILTPEKDEDGRIIDAIERVERAGGTALYVTADVTDGPSVDVAVAAAVSRFGRIDAVLHGAGIEVSRGITRKSEEQFRLIVGIKAAGAGNLISSVMKRTRPSSFLFFSSVAGRFGNAGQVDYSAGNDFMTKLASTMGARHPGTRFMTADWTAWDGPGMAGNSTIRMLLDDAGIEVLDRSEGTELACRFVGSQATLPPEVVVARALGVLEEKLARADAREVAVRVAEEVKCPGRASWTAGAVSWTLTIDPASATWLWDHAVDGTPVFPAVMGLDAFVQMASTILGNSLDLTEIEEVNLHRAIKFFNGKSRELRVAMEPVDVTGGKVRARCWLDTENRNKVEGGRVVHFDAEVVFGPASRDGEGALVLTRGDGIDLLGQNWESRDSSEDVYEHMFHGPEFQVLGDFQHGGPRPDAALGTLDCTGRIAPRGLYRLTELGMQTAGMWLLRSSGVAALPASMDSVHVLGAIEDGGSHKAISVYRGQEDHGVEGIHHRFDVSIRSETSGAVAWIEGLRLVETGARPEAQQDSAGEGRSVRNRAPAV